MEEFIEDLRDTIVDVGVAKYNHRKAVYREGFCDLYVQRRGFWLPVGVAPHVHAAAIWLATGLAEDVASPHIK